MDTRVEYIDGGEGDNHPLYNLAMYISGKPCLGVHLNQFDGSKW